MASSRTPELGPRWRLRRRPRSPSAAHLPPRGPPTSRPAQLTQPSRARGPSAAAAAACGCGGAGGVEGWGRGRRCLSPTGRENKAAAAAARTFSVSVQRSPRRLLTVAGSARREKLCACQRLSPGRGASEASRGPQDPARRRRPFLPPSPSRPEAGGRGAGARGGRGRAAGAGPAGSCSSSAGARRVVAAAGGRGCLCPAKGRRERWVQSGRLRTFEFWASL